MPSCPDCHTECAPSTSYCPSCGGRVRAVETPESRAAHRTSGAVLGSYRLLRRIGEGGMGEVFLAQHTRLGRKVALKLLRPELAGSPDALRRFFAEARAVNAISHENIVEITDFAENDEGDSYYIMELLSGASLATVLRDEGVLPLVRTHGIASQIAGALAVVHDAGIVHRDLKPENVFLIERGGNRDFVKLLDFGIAKLAARDPLAGQGSTQAGVILGTPEYMSPEQAAGEHVDHRADIYAFGVLLYEMVTGTRPFEARSLGELLLKHASAEPVAPSRRRGPPRVVPHDLDALVLECLAKDPAARPATMRDVAHRLRALRPTIEAGPEAPHAVAGPRRSAPVRVDAATVRAAETPALGAMRVTEIMTAPVRTIRARASGREAAEVMHQTGLRHLVVVDERERAIGVVSDRDLRAAQPSMLLIRDATQRDNALALIRVGDLMSTHPQSVREHDSAVAALRHMRRHKIGSLLVLDAEGRAVGIMTGFDVLELALRLLGDADRTSKRDLSA